MFVRRRVARAECATVDPRGFRQDAPMEEPGPGLGDRGNRVVGEAGDAHARLLDVGQVDTRGRRGSDGPLARVDRLYDLADVELELAADAVHQLCLELPVLVGVAAGQAEQDLPADRPNFRADAGFDGR